MSHREMHLDIKRRRCADPSELTVATNLGFWISSTHEDERQTINVIASHGSMRDRLNASVVEWDCLLTFSDLSCDDADVLKPVESRQFDHERFQRVTCDVRDPRVESHRHDACGDKFHRALVGTWCGHRGRARLSFGRRFSVRPADAAARLSLLAIPLAAEHLCAFQRIVAHSEWCRALVVLRSVCHLRQGLDGPGCFGDWPCLDPKPVEVAKRASTTSTRGTRSEASG